MSIPSNSCGGNGSRHTYGGREVQAKPGMRSSVSGWNLGRRSRPVPAEPFFFLGGGAAWFQNTPCPCLTSSAFSPAAESKRQRQLHAVQEATLCSKLPGAAQRQDEEGKRHLDALSVPLALLGKSTGCEAAFRDGLVQKWK